MWEISLTRVSFPRISYTFVVSCVILLLLIFVLCLIGDNLVSWWFQNHPARIDEFFVYESNLSRSATLYRFALAEVRLLFVYVSAAFFLQH